MKSLYAFVKKESLELIRSGKLVLLVIISCLFGIMNPFIAKITPWLMEMMSNQLAESGMSITTIKVDAITSWTQFYKNVPLLLIIFVIIMSGILTNEYQKGTLINILTKGLERWKVIIAKAMIMIGLWTICYWLCFVVTYLYNLYFWDNQIVSHMVLGASYVYLFGIWLIALILLGSTLFRTSYGVIGFVGGVFMIVYILSMVPQIQEYLPSQLLNSMSLLLSTTYPSDYLATILITLLTSIMSIGLSLVIFNKKAF